ncbi:TonB-dependent receptor [Sinomicrobium weinanense]|uniref:TonB-dependent receptor n=1 Tax=Sinomicrobium weinanense TaxID=2842200 RepID=A0A926JR53_9FLAO|nr:TonB-dependent receptor [Sinomicrobium weinanense]MBC9795975.1 TonB-dependent receptor [Sinomicrobium weinanense]MBU3122094.1 TonB-dependent receptor [Sinomicrobium weinanense]
MKIRTILVVCLIAISTWTFAQQNNAAIQGYITDTEGAPLEGTNIVIENSGRGVSSKSDGYYRIKGLSEGAYTVRASVVGYKTAYQKIQLGEGETRQLNIVLEPEVSQLGGVVLSGHKKEKYKVENVSPSLRLNQELIKIPQNIQVITDDVLRDQQIFGMREGVGRNVSGVMVMEHWGNYARVNMRGFRIPAFRNGMNFTTRWGPVAEDMAMVERIEIVKGPAGFMLSAGEPAGLYNIVTKTPTKNSVREVTLSTGSYGLQRATVDIGGKMDRAGKLLYRFNGMGHTQKSFQEYGFHDKYLLAPSLKYLFNENTSLTAQYTYQYSKVPDLGSPYVFSPKGYRDVPRDLSITHPGIDPTVNKEHSAFVTLEHKLDNNWTMTAQLGYLNGTQKGSDIWPGAVEENGDIYRDLYIFDGQEEHKLGQVFVNGEVKTGPVTHRILAGIDVGARDILYDWDESHRIDPEDHPFNIYAPDNSHVIIPELDHSTSLRKRAGEAGTIVEQQYTAYYVQDELGFLNDRLRLTLAGRYTNLDESSWSGKTSDGKFTPRAGLSFSIDDNTSVYGLYDQAFLPQAGTDRKGNTFSPIEGNNIEGGIKRKWFGGKWNTSFSYFRVTKENMLTADPEDPLNSSIQLGEVRSMGGEFDLQGEIIPGLNVILNYAYTDVRVNKDTDKTKIGNRVGGHARHMSNAWLKYTLQDTKLSGLSISAGYLYMAKRSTWDSVWGVEGAQSLPDYFRLDGALSWEGRKFRVALNINNLLNEYLFSGSSYSTKDDQGNPRFFYSQQNEPGRNFRLTLGYRF